MNHIQKEGFLHLFNRSGNVLDFNTSSFNRFTQESVGVPVCEKYGLSKGKSLEAYCHEASDDDVLKLFTDLIEYYEFNLKDLPEENGYIPLYEKCKKVISVSNMATINPVKQKIEDLIQRGEIIGKEEYHPVRNGNPVSYVSGPQFDQWMSEIAIFSERHLKTHPLYEAIHTLALKYRKSISPYKDMIGYLFGLSKDDEFFESTVQKGDELSLFGRKNIEQLLEEDIARCEQFLSAPSNEEFGQKLYTEITGRYDSIIDNFGNSLYQYYADYHFYDPEISGDTLVHNLTVLVGRMKTYLAKNYPPKSRLLVQEKNILLSNKVFIVHGHDNAAKQEMARTLQKGGFESIILHEQPDAGLTIIEKIERFSDVCFAVVLYTECDLGRDKNLPFDQEQFRARQNVVFEHGYLIGKLGRERVNALVKGNVETPGDISGVIYIPMDEAGAWKIQLAKNMKDVGLLVDMNTFVV